MQLKTKVKVGNITNLSDARYCAGMGVDLLGFPIGNKNDQISIETFTDIAEWVAGPEFILELAEPIDEELLGKVTQIEAIKFIQMNLSQLGRLKSKLAGKSIILTLTLTEWNKYGHQLKNDMISYVTLEKIEAEERHLVEELNQQIPVLVEFEKQQLTIDDLLKLPITGIVLEGSAENKPGQKNYDHLADVLESLEVEL